MARAYAWLGTSRTDVFAPASSNLLLRVLPALMMHHRRSRLDEGNDFCAVAMDVTDAFLTVEQKIATVVKAWISNEWKYFELLSYYRDSVMARFNGARPSWSTWTRGWVWNHLRHALQCSG